VRRLSLRALTLATVVLLAAGCASTGTSSSSAPAGTLDKIRATKTITLGYRDSSVPFSYLDSSRQPIGYSIDLCNAVVDDLRRELKLPDLQPKWVPVTVESRVSAVMSGTIDIECGSTTNTLSRQEQVDFSLTTFITGASLLAMPGTDASGDLSGIRIAVIPGTTTEAIIRDVITRAGAASRAQIVAVKDHADGLAALVNKTADVYASDRAILIGLAMSSARPLPVLRAVRPHAPARRPRVPPVREPRAGPALPVGRRAPRVRALVRPVGPTQRDHRGNVRDRGVARVA
jgi:glutamate/aspartate transport system substrate-binding protein